MEKPRDLKLAERNFRIAARRLTIAQIKARQQEVLEEALSHPIGPGRAQLAREFTDLIHAERALDRGTEHLKMRRGEQRFETRGITRHQNRRLS